MVIGTFAYCGSGQDTLADGFCRYKMFKKFSLGDIIRQIADDRKLSHKRSILQEIREECDQLYGREFIPLKLVEVIRRYPHNDIILTGIRTIEEYEIFKKELGCILVFVCAEEKIRFQRMLKRADEKDERSYQALKKRMDKECSMFDYQELERCADFRFDFNMELNDYLDNECEIIFDIYEKLKKE